MERGPKLFRAIVLGFLMISVPPIWMIWWNILKSFSIESRFNYNKFFLYDIGRAHCQVVAVDVVDDLMDKQSFGGPIRGGGAVVKPGCL